MMRPQEPRAPCMDGLRVLREARPAAMMRPTRVSPSCHVTSSLVLLLSLSVGVRSNAGTMVRAWASRRCIALGAAAALGVRRVQLLGPGGFRAGSPPAPARLPLARGPRAAEAVCHAYAVAVVLTSRSLRPQPKEIMEIKDFLLTARRKDARCACPRRLHRQRHAAPPACPAPCRVPQPSPQPPSARLNPRVSEPHAAFAPLRPRADALSRRASAAVKIKKTARATKFKVRCSKYLYTLRVLDSDKADKLKQSLPPGLTVQEI